MRGLERQEAKTGILRIMNVWRRFHRDRDLIRDGLPLKDRQGRLRANTDGSARFGWWVKKKGDRLLCRLFSLLAFC
ncbi:hypothetical protein BH713_00060 [Enterobacter kobei]|uniref:Uncharacterized protein n=1 Tax=Enterobacter kobei TaxID=208224 RepID=A0ACC8S6T5_9ENTR|nr:hypothetical protein BH713_00060 [Enterobacter kobei]